MPAAGHGKRWDFFARGTPRRRPRATRNRSRALEGGVIRGMMRVMARFTWRAAVLAAALVCAAGCAPVGVARSAGAEPSRARRRRGPLDAARR